MIDFEFNKLINKQETFCGAPWFQIRNTNNMSKAVCCVISDKITENIQSQSMSPLEYLNTKPIIDLKKDLATGVKSKHCNKCWADERNGIKSYRQELNYLRILRLVILVTMLVSCVVLKKVH